MQPRSRNPVIIFPPTISRGVPKAPGPLQYCIEERRRTVYVTSTVPPRQWDPNAVNDIFKMANIPESGSEDLTSPDHKRSRSFNDRETTQPNKDDRPRSARLYRNGGPSRSDMCLGIPNPDTSTPPNTPLSARGSPRTPRIPLRKRIMFYHKQDPHYGFTNFSPHAVWYDNKRYPTSEHLFQSFKFHDHRPDLAEHVRTCSEWPSVAFQEARRFQPEVMKDWMNVNIGKMDEAIWHKFTQHSDLRGELLATGDAELVEDSDKDAFWGIGADGSGRNELGKALERLRDKLREA